jgi:aspartate aminotransferase
MKFSKKIEATSSPASITVAQRVSELKQLGLDIIDLSVGQPDFTPQLNNDEYLEILSVPSVHKYSSSFGLKALRDNLSQFLSNKHAVTVPAEQIVITPGLKLGIYYLISAIADPQSSIVVAGPTWISHSELAQWNDNNVEFIEGTLEHRYIPTNQQVLSGLTACTKLVIIGSPVNPSGVIWPKQQLTSLYNELAKRGVFMLIDAIYDDFDFNNKVIKLKDFTLDGDSSHLIYAHGFSKAFAMSGHRLGYLVCPPLLIEKLTIAQAQLMTCPSTFAQHMALRLLKDDCLQKHTLIIDQYRIRSEAVRAALDTLGLEYIKPDGTFYLLLKTEWIATCSIIAAETLLEKCHVATVPGIAYGKSLNGYVRISLVQDTQVIIIAVKRIAQLSSKI